ncbi:MAG: 2-aminoadipate aminotransferase, partial [uncultured bacterium]
MTTATAAPFASPLTLPTITPELFAPPTNKPPAELAITRVLARLEAERRDLGRDVISFGGGLPSPRTFDVRNYERHARAYFKHIAQRAQQGDIAAPTDPYKVWQSVLNYTDTRAQWWIRNDFAEAHSRDMGFRIDPNRLVPTQGNTQGIHALLQYYNQLGVPVAIFCERQAYTGMLTAAKQMPNLKIFSVDMDEDGMKPEHLIARQREAMAKGFIPGMIYLVPDGGNPSGITISQQRRDDLYRQNLELARETGKIAYFFEDSPYYLIRVGSANTAYPKPMAANDPAGVVIYAFSASKIGYPGKRVGWLHLPMAWCSTDAEGHNLTLHAEATAQIAATVLLH